MNLTTGLLELPETVKCIVCNRQGPPFQAAWWRCEKCQIVLASHFACEPKARDAYTHLIAMKEEHKCEVIGESPKAIETAMDDILAVSESGASSDIERSNLFDSWKRTIVELTEDAIAETVQYRAVLGFLIATTRNKDLANFDAVAIGALTKVTNILRRRSLQDVDAQRAMHILRDAGLRE